MIEFISSYIDQGRNPQLYTKDCMEKALAKNEQVKGKIDAYRVRELFHSKCSFVANIQYAPTHQNI